MVINKIIKAIAATLIFLAASTGVRAEAESAIDHLPGIKCGTFPTKGQTGKKIQSVPFMMREDGLQARFASPSGWFLFHYDTTGENAVPLTDLDHNGVPDYIDSAAYYFDYVYNLYVNQLGYQAPFADSGKGSSDACDVYFVDIGNGGDGDTFYGLTDTDTEILPVRGFKRYASFMLLDNNYSPMDSTLVTRSDGSKVNARTYATLGVSGMKITAAHEFHHVIQFTYGQDPNSGLLNEMVSTYFESRVFPEIKDYMGFVRQLFRTPQKYYFGSGDQGMGYFYAILGQYLQKKYGDEIIRRLWQLVGSQVQGYKALDSALKEKGSSLPAAWCEFMSWIYYTGSRAEGENYLSGAEMFPEINFYSSENFSAPSVNFGGDLYSFEFRAFRTIFPVSSPYETNDTVDLIVANNDLAAAGGVTDRQMPFVFVVTNENQPGSIPVEGTRYYYKFIADKGNMCPAMFIHPGKSLQQKAYAYPDPFRPGRDKHILFPAPDKSLLDENVKLTIYNPELHMVLEAMLKVGIDHDNKIIEWKDIPSDITSGVYIFSLKYKNEDYILGKFAIIR